MELTGGRTAIVVPFTLPDALEGIRLDHVSNARLGVPAHVTLLFPFVSAAALEPADLQRAATVVGAATPFEVEFREAMSFDPGATEEGVVWLAPKPPDPFIALTNALARAFPGYLPYGGLHDEVIPHLTLANVDVDVPALVGAATASLPFSATIVTAVLLVEDDAGRWRIERELPFA